MKLENNKEPERCDPEWIKDVSDPPPKHSPVSTPSTTEKVKDDIVPKRYRGGDRVQTKVELKVGRVSEVYQRDGKTYYKVEFQKGSPFIDDWSIFREDELTIK